jgi:hypothetical protein
MLFILLVLQSLGLMQIEISAFLLAEHMEEYILIMLLVDYLEVQIFQSAHQTLIKLYTQEAKNLFIYVQHQILELRQNWS